MLKLKNIKLITLSVIVFAFCTSLHGADKKAEKTVKPSAETVNGPLDNDNNPDNSDKTTPPAIRITNPDFKKTALGIAAVIAPGTAWYYMEESNKEDQFFKTKDEFMDRFIGFKAWNFDTNIYETNAMAHPLAGTLYFLSARCNGYSSIESYMFAFGGSTLWEYFIEYKEVISINDMIHTPVGGYTIGETLFQLSSFYAANSPKNWLSDAVSRLVGNEKYRYRNGLSKNGRTTTIWNRMKAFAAASSDQEASPAASIGLDLELYSIRNLKRAGIIRGLHLKSPYSHGVVSVTAGEPGLKGFYMYMETGFLSYVNQKMKYNEDNSGGYSIALSLGSAFEYNNRYIRNFRDKLGAIHLAGTTSDISLKTGNFIIRLKNSIFGDFAMVQSLGTERYLETGHDKKDILQQGAIATADKGYYYACGFTGANSISLEYRKIQGGIDLTFNSYWSLNADGRTNREVGTGENFVMQDNRKNLRLWLLYNTDEKMSYMLSGDRTEMEGSAEGYSKKLDETRYQVQAVYNFR